MDNISDVSTSSGVGVAQGGLERDICFLLKRPCYICMSGILMWEIWTGGEMPYGRTKNTEVIDRVVHKGFRLEKPPNCPDSMYEVMEETWKKVRLSV